MAQFEAMGDYLARLLVADVFLALAVLGILFYLLRKTTARLLGLSSKQAVWFGWSVAGLLAFTLRPFDSNGTGEVFWLVDANLWGRAFDVGSNWVLNILLFIPPALLLVIYRKNVIWVWVGLAATSVLLESIQAFTQWGVGDPADLVANSVGAAIGAAFGLGIRALVGPRATKTLAR